MANAIRQDEKIVKKKLATFSGTPCGIMQYRDAGYQQDTAITRKERFLCLPHRQLQLDLVVDRWDAAIGCVWVGLV